MVAAPLTGDVHDHGCAAGRNHLDLRHRAGSVRAVRAELERSHGWTEVDIDVAGAGPRTDVAALVGDGVARIRGERSRWGELNGYRLGERHRSEIDLSGAGRLAAHVWGSRASTGRRRGALTALNGAGV